MSLTRSQRLRDAARGEAQRGLIADASIVQFSFADGWSVRRLRTAADVRREGYLMRHCVPRHVGDILEIERPRTLYARTERSMADDEGAPTLTVREGAPDDFLLYSLRDADNMPRATMWASASAHEVYGALAISNHPLSASLRARLDQCLVALAWGTLEECERRLHQRIEVDGQIERVRYIPEVPAQEPWTPEEEARFMEAYNHQDDDDPLWVAEVDAVAQWLDERMAREPVAGLAEQFEQGIAA